MLPSLWTYYTWLYHCGSGSYSEDEAWLKEAGTTIGYIPCIYMHQAVLLWRPKASHCMMCDTHAPGHPSVHHHVCTYPPKGGKYFSKGWQIPPPPSLPPKERPWVCVYMYSPYSCTMLCIHTLICMQWLYFANCLINTCMCFMTNHIKNTEYTIHIHVHAMDGNTFHYPHVHVTCTVACT